MRQTLIRQAIQTKYYGPTNTRGARIRAKAAAGSLFYSWDYEKDAQDNHRKAAESFRLSLGWTGDLVGGCLSDGSYAWVLVPAPDRTP